MANNNMKDVPERFNLQLFFIEDLAKRLQKIGTNLSKANNGLISAYRVALGELYTLFNLLLGADLNFSKRHKDYIRLNLEIGENLQYLDLREGVNYLRNALERLLYIIKLNDLLFPKRARGISFKKFVERETGIRIKWDKTNFLIMKGLN